MRGIEWRPIGLGIGVALGLFGSFVLLQKICCPFWFFFILFNLVWYTADPTIAIFYSIYFPFFPPLVLISYFPLYVGSFVVGRYSTKEILLQKLSVGIFYYLLSWACWGYLFFSGKIDQPTVSSVFSAPATATGYLFTTIDTLIFPALGYLFYWFGKRARKKHAGVTET